MLAYQSNVSVRTRPMKQRRPIHERVSDALAACKAKPMAWERLVLIYEIPDATARRIVREVEAMHGGQSCKS